MSIFNLFLTFASVMRKILSVLFLLCPLLTLAQGFTNRAYWTYIDKYKEIAVEQMHQFRIPASITLAQGLLESGAGQSRLAREAHNHFGIKCHNDWTGPYILVDDDAKGERFRKYKNDRESFIDHSRFLQKKRYERLFSLKLTDYKGWARGLKACGYATSPVYADNLIRIIELYSLHQFDTKSLKDVRLGDAADVEGSRKKKAEAKPARRSRAEIEEEFFSHHMVYKNNGNYFIVIEAGDNLSTISEATGVSLSKLYRYNDLYPEYVLSPGDIVYLKNKRSKGAKEFAGVPHVVEVGQSLYDISQMYGIHLKNLYKLNALSPDYVAKKGDLIWVR